MQVNWMSPREGCSLPEEWVGPHPATYPGSRVHAPKNRLSLKEQPALWGSVHLLLVGNQKQDQSKGKQIVSQHAIQDMLSV